MKTVIDIRKMIADEKYCSNCRHKRQCDYDLILCTGAVMILIAYHMIMRGEY